MCGIKAPCRALYHTTKANMVEYFLVPPGVPPDPVPPRQNKLHSLRLFCFAKNQSTVPLFFLSAKSHARLSCSLINALTTLSCRYQLFAVLGACSRCLLNGRAKQKFRSSLFKGLQGFGTESRTAVRRQRNTLDKTIFEGYKGNFFTKKVSL